MKRGLSTALAVASLLNLWAAAADPQAQKPSQTQATTTQAPTPSPKPQSPAAPQGGKVIIRAATGGKSNKETTKPRRHVRKHARVKAAGDPGVTIKDFSFGPSSVTVHVGDTISWSNAGPSAHTATANNGSFDTGTLNKGQSGSHTFTTAGTFAYHCTIHPFMHGTIVVAAAAGSPSSSNSNASPAAKPATGSTAGTATQSKSALPNTGVDIGSLLLSGALMLGAGLLLRGRMAQS